MSSHIANGNGNGKGASGLLHPANPAERETTASETRDSKGSVAVFKTRDGVETRGDILRLARYAVAFEFCNPVVVLRTSEVLDKFKILIEGRMVYSGRAVVGGLIDAGARIICEVKLDDLGAEPTSSCSMPAPHRTWSSLTPGFSGSGRSTTGFHKTSKYR